MQNKNSRLRNLETTEFRSGKRDPFLYLLGLAWRGCAVLCSTAPLAPGCATNAPVGKCTGAAKMRQHFPLGAIHWWRKTVCASSAPVNFVGGANSNQVATHSYVL